MKSQERGMAGIILVLILAIGLLAYFANQRQAVEETMGANPDSVDRHIQGIVASIRADPDLCQCNFREELGYVFDETDPHASRSIWLTEGLFQVEQSKGQFQVEQSTCKKTVPLLYGGQSLGPKMRVVKLSLSIEGSLRTIAYDKEGKRQDIIYTEGTENSLRALIVAKFDYPEGQMMNGYVLPAKQMFRESISKIALKLRPDGQRHVVIGCDNQNPVHEKWFSGVL